MAELARIETVVFLQSVDFFAHCKAEEVLRIAAIAQERSFQAGDRIYNASDPADTFYSVVRGTVELDAAGSAPTLVPPLGTFGQVDILRGRLHTRGASAQTDCLLLAIEADDFFDLLSNNVEIVKALFRHVIESLQQGRE